MGSAMEKSVILEIPRLVLEFEFGRSMDLSAYVSVAHIGVSHLRFGAVGQIRLKKSLLSIIDLLRRQLVSPKLTE